MNEQKAIKEDALNLIREVEENPTANQRILSQRLNISLGKTNYLIKELIKKGIIKVADFTTNPGKARKIKYVLTQKGIEEKIILTYHFLKHKEKEYKRLKAEYERMQGGNDVKR